MSKGPKPQPVAVIGAGSWGTALAIQFARAGRRVSLWARDPSQIAAMKTDGQNTRYLPDAPFPDRLTVEGDLAKAVGEAADVLVAVPSHAFRETLTQLEPMLGQDVRICWATKGFEESSGKLPHQVASDVLGEARPKAVMSGPTFAKEVGAGLPTAMTVASPDEAYARELAASISSEQFRAYTSTDIVGVEVGGAVKNVLAIGAGITDGLGFGANTRIALISRGLKEMTRLGVALGAQPETFMGLAGIGDLMLTCTDNLSRNRRMGLALAAGKTVAEAEKEIQQVVEGVRAAKAVWLVSHKLGVEMPIADEIYRLIYEGADAKDAVTRLMTRALKPE